MVGTLQNAGSSLDGMQQVARKSVSLALTPSPIHQQALQSFDAPDVRNAPWHSSDVQGRYNPGNMDSNPPEILRSKKRTLSEPHILVGAR